MSPRDRSISLVLFIVAGIAWIAVAAIFTNVSPLGDAGAQLLGALALGLASGLTAWPLLWSASGRTGNDDERHRSLGTAARRSALIALVVSILVVLRALDVVAPPVLVFLLVSAVLVEVAFTLRR